MIFVYYWINKVASLSVKYCEKNFCLTKVQTRFSCYKKPELKRPANVFSCGAKL